MTEHDDWLNQTLEEVIDPELPICDAHHHLRRPDKQCYLAADFIRDASGGHNIKQSVFVQSVVNLQQVPGGSMTPVEETEFVIRDISSVKSNIDIAAGIVGYADLTLEYEVAPILESHIAVGNGRFRGIRYTPDWHPDATYAPKTPSTLTKVKFQEGFANLSMHNLTYELMLEPHQFPALADLAKRFPETPIIVDHIGWSGNYSIKQRNERLNEWKSDMSSLVPYANVYIKLGGLGMIPFGFGWSSRKTPPGSMELAEAMAPYYLYCIELFSVKRCMFESNFPVDRESYSYTIMWNAFKRITEKFSDTERLALFHDTAATVYRL